MKKVTIVTKAFNTVRYIEQCIKSVLSQSYKEFEYILIDNGSTDGSTEIMKRYAEQDRRIRFVRFERNQTFYFYQILREYLKFDYYAMIDSDDWWEPDYLRHLIDIEEQTGADIVCAGTQMHDVSAGKTGFRKLPQQIVLFREQFEEYYPIYHEFLRPTWGMLMRVDTINKAIIPNGHDLHLTYGTDTLTSFAILRVSKCLVIDNTVLYHYRIHNKSVSYQYDPRRFDSDVYLYNDAIDFLSSFGTIRNQNYAFLSAVYANSVKDTVFVIKSSALSDDEKMREYRRIAEHSVTKENFLYKLPDVHNSKKELLIAAISSNTTQNAAEDLSKVLFSISHKCAKFVSISSLQLLVLKSELLDAFIEDDTECMLVILLDMIRNNELTKKFDLFSMVQALSSDHLVLRSVDDKILLRRFGNVYLMVWRGRYAEALETMTEILENGEKINDVFLQLYINIAALLEKPDEFLYGKLRSAGYYLYCKKYVECREELNDLAEMGVEDNDEILRIKKELDAVGE
jgi:glycosyltransferase involved in cell wall biosynthesis